MRDRTRFSLSETAHILHAGGHGLPVLLEALKTERSIYATTDRDAAVVAVQEPEQKLYVQTAGSSGTPKVIRRNPNSWRASFETNRTLFDVKASDTYAIFGHLSHSLALYGIMEALHLGCGLAVLAEMSPRRQCAAVQEFSVSVVYATPTQLRLLSQSAKAPLPDVRLVLCGGGKLDMALRDKLSALLPNAHVFEFFGASETSFITLADAGTPSGSVGRAYPGVALRIDQSEIWINSPYLFEGYETGENRDTRRKDGFLSIGEMGYLDANGYLFLQGRRSRMVTVADQNIFPEAIEALLLAQPGVQEAAVITPAEILRGHSVVAVVVGDADQNALRSASREALGAAAVPRSIVFRTKLPKLPAGKPDLQLLLKLWQEGNL